MPQFRGPSALCSLLASFPSVRSVRFEHACAMRNLRFFAIPVVLMSSTGMKGECPNLAGKKLQRSLWSRPFVEDCAQSLVIEPETETVFLRELRDFCLSIFFV
jgi:hypothetical protein